MPAEQATMPTLAASRTAMAGEKLAGEKMAGVTIGATAGRQRPGRPRSGECDRAIEDAALQLLVDEGFGRMSMEGIAARAGVGKATVYRRWDSKERLVVEAVRRRFLEHVVAPDTGSVRSDMLELLSALHRRLVSDGAVMQAFSAEQSRHPDLGAMFRAVFLDDRRSATRAILERAVARGELAPSSDIDLLADVGPALLWQRMTVLGTAPDAGLPERIVAQFFSPAASTEA
ncbi:MAG: TetR/AcrR family transcriptional regulator [Acidimicrobiales bacterium]